MIALEPEPITPLQIILGLLVIALALFSALFLEDEPTEEERLAIEHDDIA